MITIYKVSDYKKRGGLKKSAKALYTSDSENYTDIAREIKELGVTGMSTPYFFTCIHGVLNGEDVRIKQSVIIGIDKQEVPTSPTTLAKALKLR